MTYAVMAHAVMAWEHKQRSGVRAYEAMAHVVMVHTVMPYVVMTLFIMALGSNAPISLWPIEYLGGRAVA